MSASRPRDRAAEADWSPAPHSDSATSARLARACLDLTSLNDGDTEADIARLCRRAKGPFGLTAAVCVRPRRAAFELPLRRVTRSPPALSLQVETS